MKIICAKTHHSVNAIACIEAFAEGIKKYNDKYNDEVDIINNVTEMYKLRGASLVVQVALETRYRKRAGDLRWALKKWADDNRVSRFILEPGTFSQINNRYNDGDLSNRYYQICLNGIKAEGLFVKNGSEDRWEHLRSKYKIEVYDWSWEPTKPIIVLGQNESGTSVQNVKILGHHDIVVENLSKTYPENKIYYLPHPNQEELPKHLIFNGGEIKICRSSEELKSLLLESFFVYGYTTNAVVDAVLCGKPVYTTSKNNITILYKIGMGYLSELNKNYIKNGRRAQFLNDLAWQNWSIDEMASGEVWRYIRKYVGGV